MLLIRENLSLIFRDISLFHLSHVAMQTRAGESVTVKPDPPLCGIWMGGTRMVNVVGKWDYGKLESP